MGKSPHVLYDAFIGENLDPVKYTYLSFPGKIHLITTDAQVKALEKDFTGVTALGFDTETKPSFKKGESHKVALLQISTENEAYLIRLHYISQFQIFKNLFENPDILKVGLAIKEDLKQLQKIFQFTPKNFVDLQNLAKAKGLKNFGLKGMTEEVLEATITKGPKTTNWEAKELTDKQMMYAATDAWIGLMLYQKLV